MNKTLAPEKVEACLIEIAKWYVKNRREMKASDLRPIATKYFGSGEELTEFYDYMASPEGGVEFRKQLRREAWKAGLAGPETSQKIWHLGESKFPLGQIVMTRGVNDLVAENAEFAQFVAESLRRHARGDWGDLPEEDKKENELALKAGNLRLFSAYTKPGLPKIWIITEADRSATTILFPSEY